MSVETTSIVFFFSSALANSHTINRMKINSNSSSVLNVGEQTSASNIVIIRFLDPTFEFAILDISCLVVTLKIIRGN